MYLKNYAAWITPEKIAKLYNCIMQYNFKIKKVLPVRGRKWAEHSPSIVLLTVHHYFLRTVDHLYLVMSVNPIHFLSPDYFFHSWWAQLRATSEYVLQMLIKVLSYLSLVVLVIHSVVCLFLVSFTHINCFNFVKRYLRHSKCFQRYYFSIQSTTTPWDKTVDYSRILGSSWSKVSRNYHWPWKMCILSTTNEMEYVWNWVKWAVAISVEHIYSICTR